MSKPDIICETTKTDLTIIVTYQPLEAWLSIQFNEGDIHKATSVKLTLDQAAHLMNTYWPREFPVFQQWRADHGK